MNSSIRIRTLTDGGQQAEEIARAVADLVGAAQRSLDLAQYDFNLGPETAATVAGALRDAAARGVAVRIIYNVDHENPIPVPPPPEPDVQLISTLGVPARAIAGVPDLMHHKFVVRDGEAVWTGSTNWTDDAWTREENVIVVARSPAIAGAFVRDFDELWTTATPCGRSRPSCRSRGRSRSPGSPPRRTRRTPSTTTCTRSWWLPTTSRS